VQEPKVAESQVVVLDLRKRGISRGENYQDGDLALPKGRLKVDLSTFGSDEGNYEVRISEGATKL